MKNLYAIALFLFFINTLSAQETTLQNIMSAPFLSNLVISSKTDRLAWVENAKGVRNIYIATKPDHVPVKITNFTQDDGIDIAGLTWTDDEKTLFFVRGNPPQIRAPQAHNPAHVLEGAAPILWKWDFIAKKMEKLGNFGTPSVFGDKMLITKGGQIHIKNINDTLPLKQVCQVRNGAGQVRWSPDGKKIAFVSNRGAHSFVGVYDFDKNDYAFINPSVDNDTEPCWSPDSKQIAFLRLRSDPEPNVIFFPVRETEPWSLVVADVQNIQNPSVKTIFTADKGSGSAYWNHTGKQQLFWTATNKIIFAWEKTGWQQLYAVSPEGGRVEALTNCNFEVDEVLLSNDKKQVIYTSNEGNIDTKDVFIVNTEGGKPKLLVEDLKNQYYGVEFNICPASDNETVYFLRSEALAPARVYSAKNGKLGNPLMLMDRGFPMENLVTPEALTLTAKDGISFQNQVFYPKNMDKNKKYPAVIFVHGGSRRQMYLAYHSSWYYINAYHLSQYFASKGYIAMSINYRSGIGYGMHFREAENYGASGNSEFQDLEAAGEWLKAHPSVSPSKIGVWGGSYGGYMTAHALARRSDLFAAGADIHGVHNWNTELPAFVPQYDSLHYPKHAQIAYKSSPMNYIDGWKSPVFIAHADDDQNVLFSETEYLVRVLRRKGIEHELLIIPDDVHSFLRYENWYKIFSGVANFFDRKLKN